MASLMQEINNKDQNEFNKRAELQAKNINHQMIFAKLEQDRKEREAR